MSPRNFAVPLLFVSIALYAPASAIQEETAPCLDANCLASEAEAASSYVDRKDLAVFAEDLARAGRFSAARKALERMSPSPFAGHDQRAVGREIAFLEYAAASWIHPKDVVGLDVLDEYLSERSGGGSQLGAVSNFWLLAENIIEKFHPAGSYELAELLRRKVVRSGANATLDDLLSNRWPRAIELLPEKEQGELWNYMAQIYTELGNSEAAAAVLDRAEQRGGYDFQGNNAIFVSTTHSWLRLGNFDRAIEAARQIEPKEGRSKVKLQVAQAVLSIGQKQLAHTIFKEAADDFERYPPHGFCDLCTLIEIAQGYIGVGDFEAAHRTADQVLEIARRPGILPSGQLEDAARAYNIARDHARALELLREALPKMPDPHSTIGTGVTLGPISGSTLGVGD